jgi:hypothetical protein
MNYGEALDRFHEVGKKLGSCGPMKRFDITIVGEINLDLICMGCLR